MNNVTVIIKTIGRPTVKNAARSSFREGFKTIVVCDGRENFNSYVDYMKEEVSSSIETIILPHQWGGYGFMAGNVGVAMADTKYVAFLDDDDEFIEGAGNILRKQLENTNSPDILIPGIRFKDPITLNVNGVQRVSNDLCMDGKLGVVLGNVAMAIYKKELFKHHPFKTEPNPDYSDFTHIYDCWKDGASVAWLGEVLYLVRPEVKGSNGRGK
jgi:hypothetical protein